MQATIASNFIETYTNSAIASEKAKGVDAVALAKVIADMAKLKIQYANPLFRLPMTFAEIFSVGVLVSLISAALLRNPRVLPARA